jgi:L-rhamnose mutarotase
MAQQIAFTMKLFPGKEAEYEKRHREIWPELARLLKESGISDYHIYLDKSSNTLFAVQTKENRNSQDLANTEIVQKWWGYMSDIMETNPDKSPVVRHLEEVFKLE